MRAIAARTAGIAGAAATVVTAAALLLTRQPSAPAGTVSSLAATPVATAANLRTEVARLQEHDATQDARIAALQTLVAPTPSRTPSAIWTLTPSATATRMSTPTASRTATRAPSPTPTVRPTATPTGQVVPQAFLPMLSLRVLPETSLSVGGQAQLVATLRDASGAPMPGQRIQLGYNADWRFSHYTLTDARGVATYTLSLANNPDSTGFCGSGGFRNNSTLYQANAVYQGPPHVRADAWFLVGSNGAQTRMQISVSPSIPRGQSLMVTGRLLDATGHPLPAGRNVQVRGFYDTEDVQADANGAWSATLATAQADDGTVSALYVGDSVNTAGAVYQGSSANATVQVIGARAARPTPAPALYWMYNWENSDPAQFPQYGPFGSYHFIPWNQLGEDNGFPALRAYLDTASKQRITLNGVPMPKPVLIVIYFYASGTTYADYTPASIQARIGGSYILAPPGLPPQVAPRYNNPIWQAAFRHMVEQLGTAFDNDPRVSGIIIATGLDAETNYTKGDAYAAELQKVAPMNQFQAFIRSASEWYAAAFPHKPLWLQGFPQGGVDYALSLGIGIKHEGFGTDTGGWAYKSNAEWTGNAQVFAQRPNASRAYESGWNRFFLGGAAGTYWMFLSMLGAGSPGFIDVHSDHFLSIAENPWLGPWVTEHIGVTLDTTPSVFVALRGVQAGMAKEANSCQVSGEYRNYSLGLYQVETVGARTVPVYAADLPLAARGMIYTNPNVQPSPAVTARRTDRASGNTAMVFDVDGAFAAGLTSVTLRLVYLDAGTDPFTVQYQDSSGGIQSLTVPRAGTGRWVDASWQIGGIRLRDGVQGWDLRVVAGVTDVTVHLVEVRR